MNLNLKEFVRIEEFAKLAGLSVQTLYQYRNWRAYDLPEPDLKVGNVLFWRRSTAKAWAKRPR